jgi:hypothetical protein
LASRMVAQDDSAEQCPDPLGEISRLAASFRSERKPARDPGEPSEARNVIRLSGIPQLLAPSSNQLPACSPTSELFNISSKYALSITVPFA